MTAVNFDPGIFDNVMQVQMGSIPGSTRMSKEKLKRAKEMLGNTPFGCKLCRCSCRDCPVLVLVTPKVQVETVERFRQFR